MITFSESKIRAKIAENDGKIEILKEENDRLASFLKPGVADELLQFIEISDENEDEQDASENEEDEGDLPSPGLYTGMTASNATYALLKIQKTAKYSLRKAYDHLVKNGYKGSGNKTFEFRNFAIGVGQDDRIVRQGDLIWLKEWNLAKQDE